LSTTKLHELRQEEEEGEGEDDDEDTIFFHFASFCYMETEALSNLTTLLFYFSIGRPHAQFHKQPLFSRNQFVSTC
jgi:hypothetical protein